MALHVSLPIELEKLVHQAVKTGMHGSAGEVVREALRGFFGSLSGRPLRNIGDLRPEVQAPLQRIDAGEEELFDGEAAFAQLAKKHGLQA